MCHSTQSYMYLYLTVKRFTTAGSRSLPACAATIRLSNISSTSAHLATLNLPKRGLFVYFLKRSLLTLEPVLNTGSIPYNFIFNFFPSKKPRP